MRHPASGPAAVVAALVCLLVVAPGCARDAAEKEGLTGERFAYEAFRIVTRGPNVFILGRDTSEGKERWTGRTSRGTLFGVNTFLEKVVGVRWLMPGRWGEDIPKRKELRAPRMDRLEAPVFRFRRLNYVQDKRDDVKEWKVRNKVDTRHFVGWGRSFDDHPHYTVLLKHPEYMPLRSDGTRVPPPRGKPYSYYPTWKYCLTNEGLVKAFAASIVQRLDRKPGSMGDSMTPSDGGGWCTCENCQKYTVTDDKGRWNNFGGKGRSNTLLVLNFYNKVARIVARKHPDRVLGGAVYQEYLYPPEGPVRMGPNVMLGIANSDVYCFKMFKPERAAKFAKLFAEWSKSCGRLGYTDYSTWSRNWYGPPLPPGRPILKLMWDPYADVDALYRDFLDHAYGLAAAKHIGRIYDISERELADYVRGHPGHRQPSYDVSHELVAKRYAPHFPEFEREYAAALAAVRTEAQRQRRAVLRRHLRVVHRTSEQFREDVPARRLQPQQRALRRCRPGEGLESEVQERGGNDEGRVDPGDRHSFFRPRPERFPARKDLARELLPGPDDGARRGQFLGERRGGVPRAEQLRLLGVRSRVIQRTPRS